MSFTLIIAALFHALLLTVPFVFTWVNSELFEFNKMLVVYGYTLIIGGLWLARMVKEKRIIWRQHPAAYLVLIFLAGQAVATLFSINFHTSIFGYYSRLNGGLLSSLAYSVLFLASLNNLTKKHALPLILTAVVAAGLVSLYAIPEHFGASPSCYLINQEWTTSCWKQDVQNRVFATFGQPNWLATYLVGLLPFAWLLSLKTKKQQKFWWIVGGLMLLALWFTKSRSGLVALLAMIGVGVALEYEKVWFKKIKKFFKQAWKKWAAGGLLALLLITIATLTGRFIPTESEQNFDLSQGSQSSSIRLIVWQGALKVWQHYPWFGSGPGTFGYSYYQQRPVEHNLVSEWDNLYNKAHNEFLNYLAETGLVGFLTYLIFLVGMIWLLYRQLPTNKRLASPAGAAILGITGLSIANFFGFSTVMSNVLLFMFPVLALLPLEEEKQKKQKPLQSWQKFLLGLIAVVGSVTFWQIITLWRADWLYAQSEKLQTQYLYAGALTKLQKAAKLEPREPLYYDELANLYAKLELESALTSNQDAADQFAAAAIQNSDYALTLNPWHLNFYKTRVRIFFILAQTDERYYAQAEKVLKAAISLSPTDAQLWYNLAAAQQEEGKFNEAVETFQHTVDIKQDYVKARQQLGDLLVQLGRVDEGKAQYQFILDKLSPTDEETRNKLEQLDSP